jgi:hypothetical protein
LVEPVRRLRVRKAAGWKTVAEQDGRWKGKASWLPVAFRVSGGGRTIRAGTFQLALLVPAGGTNPFTTQIADASAAAGEDRAGRLVRVRGRREQARLVRPRPDPGAPREGQGEPLARRVRGSAKFSAKRK